MLVTRIISGALHDKAVRLRTAALGRRTVVVLWGVGIMAWAVAVTAGPAMAGVGSEPGHLKFNPVGGATTLTPTWSTSDGCPSGYQGSAQMAIFNVSGTLLSSISNVAYNVRGPFGGTLDGNMRAILRFARVPNGGSLEFTMGCYSRAGGTGQFTWIQSTLVTLSSDGKSFSTSTPSGQWATSGSNQAKGPLGGPNAGGAAANNASSSGAQSGGIAAWALALIAAACALAIGTAGYVWYRRRNRSLLM